MRLLIDEDTQSRSLVGRLRRAGYDLLTVNDAGLRTASDEEVLARAAAEDRVLVTRNCADYLELHHARSEHAGIICVYAEAEPHKCMSDREIVAALAKLESSGAPLAGVFHSLNAWR
ncbi:DUF5615 family PIN-like protein [Planctomycetota bacterium]